MSDELRVEQERLLDYVARVFSQAVTAGNRVSLADPQGEWIAPQLGGSITGLTPERLQRMRVIDTADEIGFQQAQAFREEEFAPTFRGEEYNRQIEQAVMADMELGDMMDFMGDDGGGGAVMTINIPQRNREEAKEGQVTPRQSQRPKGVGQDEPAKPKGADPE